MKSKSMFGLMASAMTTVLTALSSPTIRDNFIVNNEAINTSRATSAGGGIRSGDGAPHILPGDSLRVTFSLFPRTFAPPLLAIYSPRLIFTSRFGLGTTRFEKNTRFRIIGTLAVAESDGEAPDDFRLEQNYPNPFNPGTKLRFHLPEAQHVLLRVYDELGREAYTARASFMKAGTHEVVLAAQDFAAGVYYVVVRAKKFEARRKIVVVR